MSVEGKDPVSWYETACDWYQTGCDKALQTYDEVVCPWAAAASDTTCSIATWCWDALPSIGKAKALPTTVKELKSDDLYGRIKKREAEAFLVRLKAETTPVEELTKLADEWINRRSLPADIITAHKAYLSGLLTKNHLSQLCILHEASMDPDRCEIVDDDVEEFLKGVSNPQVKRKKSIEVEQAEIRKGYAALSPLDKAFVRYNVRDVVGNPCPLMMQLVLPDYSDFQIWPTRLHPSQLRLVENEELKVAVAPSVALLSIMNRVRYGEEAIDINPTFGHSNKLSRWFKTDNRDAYIPCTELFQIGEVHGTTRAHPLTVYLHDGYHINLDGRNGRRFRELSNSFAQFFYRHHQATEGNGLLPAAIAGVDRDIPLCTSCNPDRMTPEVGNENIAIGFIRMMFVISTDPKADLDRSIDLFFVWLDEQGGSLKEDIIKVLLKRDSIEWLPNRSVVTARFEPLARKMLNKVDRGLLAILELGKKTPLPKTTEALTSDPFFSVLGVVQAEELLVQLHRSYTSREEIEAQAKKWINAEDLDAINLDVAMQAYLLGALTIDQLTQLQLLELSKTQDAEIVDIMSDREGLETLTPPLSDLKLLAHLSPLEKMYIKVRHNDEVEGDFDFMGPKMIFIPSPAIVKVIQMDRKVEQPFKLTLLPKEPMNLHGKGDLSDKLDGIILIGGDILQLYSGPIRTKCDPTPVDHERIKAFSQIASHVDQWIKLMLDQFGSNPSINKSGKSSKQRTLNEIALLLSLAPEMIREHRVLTMFVDQVTEGVSKWLKSEGSIDRATLERFKSEFSVEGEIVRAAPKVVEGSRADADTFFNALIAKL